MVKEINGQQELLLLVACKKQTVEDYNAIAMQNIVKQGCTILKHPAVGKVAYLRMKAIQGFTETGLPFTVRVKVFMIDSQ